MYIKASLHIPNGSSKDPQLPPTQHLGSIGSSKKGSFQLDDGLGNINHGNNRYSVVHSGVHNVKLLGERKSDFSRKSVMHPQDRNKFKQSRLSAKQETVNPYPQSRIFGNTKNQSSINEDLTI